MGIRLHTTLAVLAAASTVVSMAPAANAALSGNSPTVASAVDLTVPRAANSAVSFQTLPDARCILSAAGTRSTMTVYADDRGTVSLHLTPSRNGAANAGVTAKCDARGVASTKLVRLHVVAGAAQAATPRPAIGAQPLVPRGVNPSTLSAADLNRLQLPPRPDAVRDPQGYAQWLRAVTLPVRRVTGSTILRTDVIHGPAKRTTAMHPTRKGASGVKNDNLGSYNWSGITDTGSNGQFAYWVAGQWIVPGVYTDNVDSPAYSSLWDGIDGWGSGDVIQNGTEQDAYNIPFFGSLSFYSAWYEFYPDNGSTTLPNFNVNPGDAIYAVSWLCYDGSGQRYGCYYMEDMTQGEASPVYYELGSQPGLFAGNSAEWVLERPTVGGNLNPLPQFSDVPFWWEHVYDNFAGGGRNACDETINTIDMFNGGDQLDSAATAGCDSSSFHWLLFQ